LSQISWQQALLPTQQPTRLIAAVKAQYATYLALHPVRQYLHQMPGDSHTCVRQFYVGEHTSVRANAEVEKHY
jgi:hypothetical protein